MNSQWVNGTNVAPDSLQVIQTRMFNNKQIILGAHVTQIKEPARRRWPTPKGPGQLHFDQLHSIAMQIKASCVMSRNRNRIQNPKTKGESL